MLRPGSADIHRHFDTSNGESDSNKTEVEVRHRKEIDARHPKEVHLYDPTDKMTRDAASQRWLEKCTQEFIQKVNEGSPEAEHTIDELVAHNVGAIFDVASTQVSSNTGPNGRFADEESFWEDFSEEQLDIEKVGWNPDIYSIGYITYDDDIVEVKFGVPTGRVDHSGLPNVKSTTNVNTQLSGAAIDQPASRDDHNADAQTQVEAYSLNLESGKMAPSTSPDHHVDMPGHTEHGSLRKAPSIEAWNIKPVEVTVGSTHVGSQEDQAHTIAEEDIGGLDAVQY